MAYVTLAEIRAFGIAEDDLGDAEALAMAEELSRLVDMITGQWFEPRTVTFKVDGTGSDALLLNVPIIEVTSLKINGSNIAADPSRYTAYTGRNAAQDDRLSPKILLGSPGGLRRQPGSRNIFAPGRLNQEISGSFGWVEEDQSTPVAIKRAVLLMMRERMLKAATGDSPEDEFVNLGPVIEEATDGHVRKWGMAHLAARKHFASAFTDDPEVGAILAKFRRKRGSVSGFRW